VVDGDTSPIKLSGDPAVAIAWELDKDGLHDSFQVAVFVRPRFPGFVQTRSADSGQFTCTRNGELSTFGLYHLASGGKGMLARFTHRRRKSTSNVARPRAASSSATRF